MNLTIIDKQFINYLNSDNGENLLEFGNCILPSFRDNFQHDDYIIDRVNVSDMKPHYTGVEDPMIFCLNWEWKKSSDQIESYGNTHAFLYKGRIEILQYGQDKEKNKKHWKEVSAIAKTFIRESKLNKILC